MEPRDILKALKEASPFDLFLLSFLLLPFVFDAWVSALNGLNAASGLRDGILILVGVGYVVGVLLMLAGVQRTKRKEVARDRIVEYLERKGFRLMSFERVRSAVNGAYTDPFLETLVDEFPTQLRRARLRGGRPGLGILEESDADDEE